MKDIIISTRRQKKEILIWLVCFCISFIVNVVAIIVYATQWKELLTHIGYVIFLSFVLYFLFLALRIIKFAFYKIFLKKKR